MLPCTFGSVPINMHLWETVIGMGSRQKHLNTPMSTADLQALSTNINHINNVLLLVTKSFFIQKYGLALLQAQLSDFQYFSGSFCLPLV